MCAAAVPVGLMAFGMGAGTSNAAPRRWSSTPPTEAQCQAEGRHCFTPQAIQSAYDLGPLYQGQPQRRRGDHRRRRLPATTGWDPITGLGTPNAANLVSDLAS